MKIYLDTSSLFKLYKRETGSEEMEAEISNNNIADVFLSEIIKFEFLALVYKRVRMKDLSVKEAKQIIDLFEYDFRKYLIVPFDNAILNTAEKLISIYGVTGLRTLDSIQLASAIEVKEKIDKYFTSDKLLRFLFEKEKLPI